MYEDYQWQQMLKGEQRKRAAVEKENRALEETCAEVWSELMVMRIGGKVDQQTIERLMDKLGRHLTQDASHVETDTD